jgi:hypothetical protein
MMDDELRNYLIEMEARIVKRIDEASSAAQNAAVPLGVGLSLQRVSRSLEEVQATMKALLERLE